MGDHSSPLSMVLSRSGELILLARKQEYEITRALLQCGVPSADELDFRAGLGTATSLIRLDLRERFGSSAEEIAELAVKSKIDLRQLPLPLDELTVARLCRHAATARRHRLMANGYELLATVLDKHRLL